MNISYLSQIEAYDDSLIKKTLGEINLDDEIQKLKKEMEGINTQSLQFDNYDFIVMFALGLLEVAGEFVFSEESGEPSKKLAEGNSKFRNYLSETFSKSKQLGFLDYKGNNFAEGNRGGFRFAYELFMFPKAVELLTEAILDDESLEDCPESVAEKFNLYRKTFSEMSDEQLILVYLIYLSADFLKAKGLLIPGLEHFASLNSESVREIVKKMTSDGFVYADTRYAGIPYLTTEVLVRIFLYGRNCSQKVPFETERQKLNKMLLMAHTLTVLINTGKVVIRRDPTALNFGAILEIFSVVWSIIKEEVNLTHRTKEKVALGVLKNKFEALQTIILLDKTIYYTQQIDKFITREREEFYRLLEENEKVTTQSVNEIDSMLKEFELFNQKLREEIV